MKKSNDKERSLPPAFKVWIEVVDKVMETSGTSRREAMKIAKRAKDRLLDRDPTLKGDTKKLLQLLLEITWKN